MATHTAPTSLQIALEQHCERVLSLVKMLSGLNAFGISNIHGGEFKVCSLWESNVTMLRFAKIRRKEFLRTTGLS